METNPDIIVLHNEMDWLQRVIDQVICSYLLQEGHENRWQDIPLPETETDTDIEDSVYYKKIIEWDLSLYERLCLALILAPQIKPEVLDIFFSKNAMYDRGFTEFGGVVNKNHSGFLPTGQTLSFLITAVNPELRIEILQILSSANILAKEQVLVLESTESYMPVLNQVISINERWLHYFITGVLPKLEHSVSFPAQQISTNMDWDDLVLEDHVMNQVMEINAWLNHGETLMKEWGLENKIKPGYRTLFYGPPGTGKTLTATLLGKNTNREVYRVDLSMIVSKYIGETEKNLSKIFDVAQHKDWILFFDEADALFGKRTSATSSNDRHANQQTGYLLQRIEDFPGVVILASNLKENMDEAFSRRFQSMIHFTMPTAEERILLWEKAFSGKCQLDPDIDIENIAENYELAGGAIINVLRFCALAAIQKNETIVSRQDLLEGIRREFKKENKTLKVTQLN
ncbi:ATPase family protein associated with various cellular activities (AAA) [Flavobacterium sp. 90]|uniref:ATP-binding protein n=1 Tax=unclassified Flavobacterium TaxID=196869 RepID=UPI000EB1F78A|nr:MULTISPECIES: ATP-binding protein [unclassified Flavobacterium]RKR04863.1 ATPase family protein associated with various cellular activities (AAA) [Flavobacterium sp. 81]TCK56184.1 ATPase family protein associated with various cellular activities (AAA) [Flavobacterium sp. 90]